MPTHRSERAIREARAAYGRITGRDRPGPARYLLVGIVGALGGAAAAFLFDPQRGRTRRIQLGDRTAALVRGLKRGLARRQRAVTSTLAGKAQAARHAGEEGPLPNDEALAAKVTSELFRDPSVPKGGININVEQGRVVLRGEVPDEGMRRALEKSAAAIPGVWDVENLLHLPGEPAPTARA
ncbi:MAG TPA: BON domain-containing protein [candidate division Zixibacteria bacterium]|nr:BON domain-containing protein [candidate division Zixibacteria bacterium]